MKKIGIAVQKFPVLSETFVVSHVLGLTQKGFDVTVFAMNESAQWDRFEILKERDDIRDKIKVSVYRFSDRPFRLLMAVFNSIGNKLLTHPRIVARMVASLWSSRHETQQSFLHRLLYNFLYIGHSLDILHVEFDAQAMGVAEIKDWMGCKLVLSGRGSIGWTRIPFQHPNFYTYLFKRVDHYHFISHYLHGESIKAGLPEAVPVTIIEPAIDVDEFKAQENAAGDNFRIVSVGRLSWTKGYEFGIDAIAAVRKEFPALVYTIIGSGEYKEALEFAATQHNLLTSGVIHFMGDLNRDQVRQQLRTADLVLHPALSEGFCNAVIEAQSMQIPVVCSDAGGLPENVADGVTGFVVPRRDARVMATRILELIQNPELRRRMGNEGRKRVLENFNLNDQVDKFEKMYNSI